jgi:hypothetical protein
VSRKKPDFTIQEAIRAMRIINETFQKESGNVEFQRGYKCALDSIEMMLGLEKKK